MKSVSVKFIIPNKKDLWKGSYGTGSLIRPTATALYNAIERRLLALHNRVKINVIVDYGLLHLFEKSDWKNEGKYTTANEALYSLACFLEDYVKVDFLREKRKKYLT